MEGYIKSVLANSTANLYDTLYCNKMGCSEVSLQKLYEYVKIYSRHPFIILREDSTYKVMYVHTPLPKLNWPDININVDYII